mmetsp:Transcript_41048/g.89689  ORF Transcript_41048/g.89689 Transcript_41048/m.89689 type:complete len:108 (+) Transcript_41048:203-526(+)
MAAILHTTVGVKGWRVDSWAMLQCGIVTQCMRRLHRLRLLGRQKVGKRQLLLPLMPQLGLVTQQLELQSSALLPDLMVPEAGSPGSVPWLQIFYPWARVSACPTSTI